MDEITTEIVQDVQPTYESVTVDTTSIMQGACLIFFIGLCFGLFFGILSRAVSAVAGIIKKLIT